MKLRDLKNSMMYTACKYKREPVDMSHFVDINTTEQVRPEQDALDFYLAVQIMGVIELQYGVDTVLPDEVAQLTREHHDKMEKVFFRLFTYIMLISIGETRHGCITNKKEDITKTFNNSVYYFAETIKGTGRADSRNTFLEKERTLLAYVEYCEWAFIECFSSDSYGGKPWKNIVNKVTQVLKGEISPYIMVDVSWALVHNTGSIFNKNTIYKNDTGSGLALLLDIQRGGGIASHILNENFSNIISSTFTPSIKEDTQKADVILEGALSPIVTPLQIKEAGALHHSFISIVDPNDSNTITNVGSSPLWLESDYLKLGVTSIPTTKRGN